MEDLQKLSDIAVRAALEARELLRVEFSRNVGVLNDTGRDIKTQADLAAEEVVLNQLRPTGIPILSEESGADAEVTFENSMWIIDPLDGTFNLARGIPLCCVSIAYWEAGKPVLGVICDITSGNLYVGKVGNGLSISGRHRVVSKVDDVENAVLATGFPSQRDYSQKSLGGFIEQVQRFKKIRMIGSAAISLGFVAGGNVDAYAEEDIWLWDVAAGLALVRAAGGDYSMTMPTDTWQVNVFAHNGLLKGMFS